MNYYVYIERLLNGGKGGTQVVEKPIYTPPPAAPAVSEAATMDKAVTPEDEARKTKESLRKGARSLQIPSGSTSRNTVGK